MIDGDGWNDEFPDTTIGVPAVRGFAVALAGDEGAEAKGRPPGPLGPDADRDALLVVMGNSSAIPNGRAVDPALVAADSSSMTGQMKRILADRARMLVADTCGDIRVADKLRTCGVRVRGGLSDVAVEHHPKGYAYATGLQTCGSVWACPICSFKIRTKRAAELAVAIAVHTSRGGTCVLLTLTTQHSFGEPLDEVWSDTQAVWSYITGHSRYRKLRDELGMGYCRAMEVMHGRNGWHPHLHVVLFLDAKVCPFDTTETWNRIAIVFHDLWVGRMRNHYGRECRSSVAVDLRMIKDDGADGVGMYCTKAGYEVAMADGKEGRTRTSRHPFAIAFDAVETGDKADVELFREWIQGSHDRRMWTWSKGLRDGLGLGKEKTDEELAAEADETVARICTISPKAWKQIVRTRTGLRAQFLAILDNGPLALVDGLRLLADHGLAVTVDERQDQAPRLRLADEAGLL